MVLHDLKVTPKNHESVFTATSVTARYSLLSILRGQILVDEASVVAPTVTIVENADGTSNLDPLLKTGSPKTAKKPAPAPSTKSSTPLIIDVKSVDLKGATIRYIQNFKGGGHQTMELSNVNVAVGNLKNGGTGKLDFSAAIAMDTTLPLPAQTPPFKPRSTERSPLI